MTQEESKLCKQILEENVERTRRLLADYDPVTGKGAPGDRVLLTLPDFAIPEQYIPEEMMQNDFIREICKAGSIKKYQSDHPDMTEEGIETRLRMIRHKYDFTFWAYFCIWIKKKTGGRGRFKLNYAQIVTLENCEDLRQSGKPINLVIDKARQWGGSTFCIFYQWWLTAKWDNYHSFAIAAHVQSASHNILVMLKEAIKSYPAWDLGLSKDSHLHLASMIGGVSNAFVVKDEHEEQVLPAVIYIGSAQVPDSLRSGDISGAHYSEVGVWPNTPEKRPEDLVADISGGMSKQRALSMQVMESTAKSADDYFHDVYMAARNGESNYRAVFIPWYYIPHDSLPVEDPEAFVEWLVVNRKKDFRDGKWKMPGKYYWWLWEQGASLEGINWYRYEELNYTTRTQMVNEAPSSDIESFTAAGSKVFDIYDVERFAAKCKDPLYQGDLISEGKKGKEAIKDIRFVSREGGPLKIWEMPDDSPVSNRYVVAVDIGGPNPTSDFSSVRVLDRLMTMPEFNGKPNVVAEMHYHTDHDLLAYDAMRLSAWYNNALLVIESNTLETKDKERDTGGNGSEYILDIVSEIYPNLYMRHNKEEDVGDKVVGKWGFHTNVDTKPKIIDNMRACLRDDLWYEPSKICCGEMASYIDDHGKFTAPAKKHDDVLMATAIMLWISYKEMDPPRWIDPPKKVERPEISSNTTSHF